MDQENAAGKTGVKPAKLIIIILVVLVLGVAGLFGYLKFVKKTDSVSNAVATALNANCKYNDADLCKFINGWKDTKSFTMTNTVTQNGKTSTSIFKKDGDNSQITMSEGGKESYNTINIGKTTYTKDYTDNKWFKYTVTTNNPAVSEEKDMDFDTKAESAEDKTTYVKIGKEACGSYQCFKYKIVDPSNTTSTEYIYFDDSQYQLRKMRSEGTDGSITEGTYDYAKVTISEPSPTKDGSPADAAAAQSSVLNSSAASSDAVNSAAAAQSAAAQAAAAAAANNSDTSSSDTDSSDSENTGE